MCTLREAALGQAGARAGSAVLMQLFASKMVDRMGIEASWWEGGCEIRASWCSQMDECPMGGR